MQQRDPWIEPKSGDIVRAKTGTVRTVIEIYGEDLPNPKVIFWHERNGAAKQRKSAWIDDWKSWCKRNAIVEA